VRRFAGDITPVQGDAAAAGLEESRARPQEGCLPGAVRAEQGDDSASRHGEVDIPEDVVVAVAGGDRLEAQAHAAPR
jgi:hypothetical protein